MVAQDYWSHRPTLKEDVKHWTRSCVECQAVKITRHNKPKIGFFPQRTERFQFVHIDTDGPMDVASENNKYILTMKGRGTCFYVTVRMPNKRAVTIQNAFIQCWCGYFGIPQVIICDNGGEFKNSLLGEACNLCTIQSPNKFIIWALAPCDKLSSSYRNNQDKLGIKIAGSNSSY